MEIGFLYLQTSLSYPGMVKLRTTLGEPPNPATTNADSTAPETRYIARFNDIDAAKMHAFNAMRRHLADLEKGLFKVDLITAISAAESIDLPHRRLFLDPGLSVEALARLENDIAHRRRKGALIDNFWKMVGWLGIAWLVILALSGI